MTKYPCNKADIDKKLFKSLYKVYVQVHNMCSINKTAHNTNLGLESLMARADEAFRVIAHSVSAALACTSGVLWSK